MRYFPLDSQTQKRFCVIRKNREVDLPHVLDWLKSNMKWFALIVHDKDIDPVTHSVIPIHYHFVGFANSQRRRLLQEMNNFADVMGFDTNGLEWDGYRSQVTALQYLIHKNNPEKTQHSIDDVILYNITKEEFITLISVDSETSVSFDLIFNLCNKSENVVEFLREIPPQMFKNNYHYIRSLWNAIHNGRLNEL